MKVILMMNSPLVGMCTSLKCSGELK